MGFTVLTHIISNETKEEIRLLSKGHVINAT